MSENENKNLPSLISKKPQQITDVAESDYFYTPEKEYTIIENNESRFKSVLKKFFIGFINVLRAICCIINQLTTQISGVFKGIKKLCAATLKAETSDLVLRAPVLKSVAFKKKFALSVFLVATYSLLCAMVASKTDSAGEYMKTFFVTLLLCSVFIFIAIYLNPIRLSPAIYSICTSFLIITGVLLQVMFQKSKNYTGVADIIRNMGIGLVLGLVSCFFIIVLCRSPFQKFVRRAIAVLTILFMLVLIAMKALGKETNDAANWVSVFGASLQLSEIVKIMAVIEMALIYAREDINEKKKLFLNAIFYGILLACFAYCNELGIPIILALSFFMLAFISLKSMKLVVEFGIFACILLLIASGVGKMSYDKLYDVTDRTTAIVDNFNSYYDSEDVMAKTDNYKSYNIVITRRNTSTSAVNSDTVNSEIYHAITFTFMSNKPDESERMAKIGAQYLNGINFVSTDNGISEQKVVSPVENDNGNYEIKLKLKLSKDVSQTGGITRLAGKIYKKAIERFGLEGDQGHANQITEALHSTRWFGSEEKDIAFVPYMNSDSIFCYALMQLGVGMVSIILLVYMLMFFIILIKSHKSKEPINSIIIVGFGICISIQSVIQLGMALRIFPILGMVSAFLSNGGTATLINYTMTFFILYSMRLELPENIHNKGKKEVLE